MFTDDLQLTIDQQLKLSNHIQNAVKKANRVLGCLARTFRHLNKDTFLLLYKAMVRPHLEYASCVWCPRLIKDRPHRASSAAGNTTCAGNKGITVQQQTKRITASYLELQKTENRHNPDFQNYQNNRLGQPGLQMFTVPIKKASGTTRGHSEKLQTQRATGYRHHFFSTKVVKMWNSLSDDTVQARRVNELK
ncbi:hypothetical protein NP493_661g01036 [Ridgeia piscesae]|uniref:Uncharacterized protein n=1 Tax=Ridgeia piscesae TaxID=27915 RepID=A0AAD9NN48_RIDPI|nr:hypothetical protein NP493_661g01036 [Ridgeia piscesae]